MNKTRILKAPIRIGLTAVLWLSADAAVSRADVLFEVTTPYHHIRVVEDSGMRTLCFDDATESRMSVEQPLTGHFEYTEYFHMAFLWNAKISSVLMVGLGGASAQRSFEHYYPDITVETVEIDPNVLKVAKNYFNLTETDRQKVHVEDGRVYLFPAQSSRNVVLVATRSPASVDTATLRQRAAFLVGNKRVTVPGFSQRVEVFRAVPPVNAYQSPVLTDDFAPVEGLSAQGGVDLATPAKTNAPSAKPPAKP